MGDRLESAVREVLSERAAQLDAGAAARLRAVDYRPRGRFGLRVPVLGAAGLVGVAAAVAVVVVLSLTSGASPAFAGWSQVPTSPAPGQTANALAACGPGTAEIVDTRGPYTAMVYAIAGGLNVCVQGGAVSFSGSASGGNDATVPPPGHIQLFPSAGDVSQGRAFHLFAGRVGKGVTGVAITLGSGQSVTATVSNGWYLLWWPGSEHARTLRITTQVGIRTATLPSATLSCRGSCSAYGPAPIYP